MVKILFFSSLVLFSSCVSIPKQTAEMSVLLEQQLDALKQANNSIIENVYKEKEKNITDYVDNVWFPQYLEEYFQKPIIQEAWNEAVNTDSLEYILTKIIRQKLCIIPENYRCLIQKYLLILEKLSDIGAIIIFRATVLCQFKQLYELLRVKAALCGITVIEHIQRIRHKFVKIFLLITVRKKYCIRVALCKLIHSIVIPLIILPQK